VLALIGPLIHARKHHSRLDLHPADKGLGILLVSTNEGLATLLAGLDEDLGVLMGAADEDLRGARDTLPHFPCQPPVAAYCLSMPRAQDRRHHAASASQYSEPFPPGHRPLLLRGSAALSSDVLQLPAPYERRPSTSLLESDTRI
jgi:hypothetical protein